MTKKCIGCGVILQTLDKSVLGYTPDINKDYCMRCFRLKNYGEKDYNEKVDETLVITKVNQSKGVAFFFIDYLNINKYTLDLFKKLKLKKVLVISKVDYLRKDIKFIKIKKWLEDVYKINDDIIFISTKKGYGVNKIINYIDDNKINTSYIMGITNAGKSTFINYLLKTYNIKKEILVSDKPNTTLDFIPIQIDTYKIYDTPGLGISYINEKLLNKEIKPITFKIKSVTTISFFNYEISFLEPTSITCYFNSEKIKRSYKAIKGKEIQVKDNQDIVIPGMGFINVKTAGKVISNNEVEIRNSCFGGNYE